MFTYLWPEMGDRLDAAPAFLASAPGHALSSGSCWVLPWYRLLSLSDLVGATAAPVGEGSSPLFCLEEINGLWLLFSVCAISNLASRLAWPMDWTVDDARPVFLLAVRTFNWSSKFRGLISCDIFMPVGAVWSWYSWGRNRTELRCEWITDCL